jgi:transcriptional regulator with XRE-family HTH domain
MPAIATPAAPAMAIAPSGARLRAARLRAGLTLEALAEATGLDKGHLSRLERGLKGPSIATVLKLSAALQIPVGQLFGEELSNDAVRISRAEMRERTVPDGGAPTGFELLTQAGSAIEAFIIHLAEVGHDEGLFDHDGEELLLVLSGTVELRFADRSFVLTQGDCAQFAGHLPHRLRQIGEQPTSAMIAVSRDLRIAQAKPRGSVASAWPVSAAIPARRSRSG